MMECKEPGRRRIGNRISIAEVRKSALRTMERWDVLMAEEREREVSRLKAIQDDQDGILLNE